MALFDREKELEELNFVLSEQGSQFLVVSGRRRQMHYAFFSRSGFTDAAITEAQKQAALLVDLETLGRDLGAI